MIWLLLTLPIWGVSCYPSQKVKLTARQTWSLLPASSAEHHVEVAC